jgi:ATP-binding cassette, subfamily B, bacterial
MSTVGELLKRFPGLSSLWRSRVPFIAQSAPGECGPACVAMLACHYGRATTINELMLRSGGTRLGLRLGELQELSRGIGIDARIVKMHEVSELRWLDRPVILHWRFCHFVVLESYDGKCARILDPALGAIEIDRDELEASYTGLMLWLDAPAAARPVAAPRKPLLPFLRRFAGNMPELPGLLAICVLLQLMGLAPALLSAWALGSVVPQHQEGMLLMLAAGVLGVAVMQPLSELARNHVVVQVRSVLGLRMVTTLVDHVLRAEWKCLQQRPYGDLLNRIHANEEIRSLLTSTGVALALDGLLALLSLGLLLLISPAVSALVLLCCAIAGAGFAFLHRQRARELVELFGNQSQAHGYLVQMLMGMETIRASGIGAGVRKRWSALFGRETAASAALGRTEGRIAAMTAALNGSVGMLVLLAITGWAVQRQLSLPQALLAYSLSATLLGTASKLFLGAQHLQSVGFQAALAQDLLEIPLQPEGGRLLPLHPGALRCQGVGFAHAANVPPTLIDVHLEVPAGGLVAIVGPSGSGKSTLLNVLAGLYPAHSGKVTLGDEDLRGLDPESLRERILLVPQFPYFFSQSIRENMELARPGASLAEIRDAARQACVADEIEALPMGYETVLAEGGVGLSGGQRQRLALARAILARPAVLLLDEATSSLDARSEQGVLERLSALHCTRVIAAHRLSTVRAADTILVLEAGRVVQSGSFAQLVQQPGAFRRLFGRQLSHGEGDADAA